MEEAITPGWRLEPPRHCPFIANPKPRMPRLAPRPWTEVAGFCLGLEPAQARQVVLFGAAMETLGEEVAAAEPSTFRPRM
jgi:hypothetical protein